MLRGARLTHKYFSSDEWVTIGEDGLIELEDGVRCTPVAYMVHTDFTNIFGESFN